MGSTSRNAIAVKKLGQLAQEREREFKTEGLIGGCLDTAIEFMSNGTLPDFLLTLPRPDWHAMIRGTRGYVAPEWFKETYNEDGTGNVRRFPRCSFATISISPRLKWLTAQNLT
ncbi:hypothetical protein OIU84_022660 [Salix udensis]|uniref:Uncharacterized protein n=1 Tax=Salix udensis TaxID=889485 RepID=A0AAD6KPI7_9ROSI|nr:hypothetical protein OIU84_022660 [Salix udensis]